MKQSAWLQGIVLLLFATISWGGMYVVSKLALSVLDAYYLTAWRYGVSAVLLLIVLILAEGISALRLEGKAGETWFFGTMGYTAFPLFAFIGLSYTSAEHGAIILALMPLITALLNWSIYHRRPPGHTLACVVLALLGVLLVISRGHPQQMLQSGSGWGDLLSLLAAVSWVAYTMGAVRFPRWSALRYTSLSCALGVTSLAACILFATLVGHAHVPTWQQVAKVEWHLAYLSAVATVAAGISWNAGIRQVGALNGILFINFLPITAFVIGVLMGHRFTSAELIGSALVIAALLLNNLYGRQATVRQVP